MKDEITILIEYTKLFTNKTEKKSVYSIKYNFVFNTRNRIPDAVIITTFDRVKYLHFKNIS